MARTRTAVLQGAAECIARQGARKTTMGDIAARSRIAKATLYNHFRTKDDLLSAMVEAEVRRLAADCAEAARTRGLAAALRVAAARLATDPALRKVAADEPAMLTALVRPGDGPGWQAARGGVTGVLAAVGRDASAGAVETVLRWLVGQVAAPLPDEVVDDAVAVFVRGLAIASQAGHRPGAAPGHQSA